MKVYSTWFSLFIVSGADRNNEVSSMDITIGRTSSINKVAAHQNALTNIPRRVKRKDRRKNKQDRRKSVRDGVFVSLSFKTDRRAKKDRRKPDPS